MRKCMRRGKKKNKNLATANQFHPSYIRVIVVVWKEGISLAMEQPLQTIKLNDSRDISWWYKISE